MKRRTFVLCAPVALAACGDTVLREEIVASQAEVNRVAYAHPGPKSLTLYTMRNVGSDNGAHTGLLINASQRVLWDPAGTFGHPSIPEQNDVHFGITDRVKQFYESYHARETYYLQIQEVEVSEDVAALAYRLATTNGPTPKAACTRHTSRMLQQLPGFTSIRTNFFPDALADQFANIPGVQTRFYREDDSDDKSVAAAQIDAAIQAGQ